MLKRFRSPSMRTHGVTYREQNQVYGGLWTSTLQSGPTSAFVQWCLSNNKEQLNRRGRGWWNLEPLPDARLLQIDSLDDYVNIQSKYSYQGGAEIDFDKIKDDGWVGVHLTEQGFTACSKELSTWKIESTLWIRFAFARGIQQLDPPTWFTPTLDPQVKSRGKRQRKKSYSRRFALSGDYAGWWFRARPLAQVPDPKRAKQALRQILSARDVGVTTLAQVDSSLGQLAYFLVDHMIIDHNFTIIGLRGEEVQYPVGEGMAEILPYDLLFLILKMLLEADEYASWVSSR